jgi:hypothetical protein
MSGLSVNDVVNVQIVLSPIAAALRNFGNLMLLGSTPGVIDTNQRYRYYTSSTQVAQDFGSSAPEFLAAELFFDQVPTPAGLYIGFWAASATSAVLHGGLLSAAQQLPSVFTNITNGGFDVTIDGTAKTLTNLDFAAVSNMNGVASIVQTALGGSNKCVWNSILNRFDITSGTTGAGTAATGTITLESNPTSTDTVTINGTSVEFITALTSGIQVKLGATLAITAANLQAVLAASNDAGLSACTYSTVAATGITTITYNSVGTGGNAITLATSDDTKIYLNGSSQSSTTLAGGVNASSITFATSPTSSYVDMTTLLNLTSATGASIVQGINAESALSAVVTLAGMTTSWYGLTCCSASEEVSDELAIAAFIESAVPSRIHGVTTQDSNVLNASSTEDIAYQLKALGYNRTFTQYSSSTPYAAISLFGRAFTVNFQGQNTTLTLKFKTEPGIVAETLTESQANSATGKNCNIFVNYDNSTAIVQQGVMASGQFFDTIQGSDALANQLQTDLYNALYLAPTKIPLTEAGMGSLVNTAAGSCGVYVNNGFLAPGVWESSQTFGALQEGQTLPKGFYIYCAPVSSLDSAQRAARQGPPIQIAAKLAGAVHFVSTIVYVAP